VHGVAAAARVDRERPVPPAAINGVDAVLPPLLAPSSSVSNVTF